MNQRFETLLNWLLKGLLLCLALGQLQRWQLTPTLAIYLHDILLVVYSLVWVVWLWTNKRRPKIPGLILVWLVFVVWAGITWIIRLPVLGWPESLIGLLYLIRFGLLVSGLTITADLLTSKSLGFSLVSALDWMSILVVATGLLQYSIWPDTRWLYQFGWDDHLYRLIGTYFDPGFTGLMLLLIWLWGRRRGNQLLAILSFVSIFLTYSRASYLALVVAVLTVWFFDRKPRQIIQWLLVGVLCLFLLPRPAGEGVKLYRTQSISSRITSSISGWDVFSSHPFVGVGFNNYRSVLPEDNRGVPIHTSAPDNSYLFVLATTGVIGFIVFGFALLITIKFAWTYHNGYLLASLLAISIHAFFNNSWFYVFVWLWWGLVVALAVEESSTR